MSHGNACRIFNVVITRHLRRGLRWSALLVLFVVTSPPFLWAQGASVSYPPVATTGVDPVTIPVVPEGPPPAVELEEHLPVDAETWHQMKASAATKFDVASPDQVISVSAPLGRDVPSAFPGLAWESLNPPDTHLAKSGSRLIQVVNSRIGLYDPQGGQLQSRSLASFFGTSATPLPPFDPRVVYDHVGPSSRYYVLASQYSSDPHASKLLLAVSRSANPANLDAGGWCHYQIDTLDDQGTIHDTFADYPTLGIGGDKIVLTANHFTLVGHLYTYAVLRVLDKALLANNSAFCPSSPMDVYRPAASGGDSRIFALQPAVHNTLPSSFAGSSNPVYLVNTRWSGSDFYRVWRVANSVGGSDSILQMIDLTVALYDTPPDAPQAVTSFKLETGDNRVLQVAGMGNSLWLAHTVTCNAGGGDPESCVRVARLTVGQDGAGNPTTALAQQVVFGGGAGMFYFMPGVAVNAAERTAVPFLYSSADLLLSSAWTAKNLSGATYPTASALGNGNCWRMGATQVRTGDYVGAATGSNLTDFWISAENAILADYSRTLCVWRTDIRQVQ